MALSLTPDGRRAIKDWPSGDSGELLIQVLEAAIIAAPEGETKTKLSALQSAAREVGTQVLTGVVTNLVKGVAGIP